MFATIIIKVLSTIFSAIALVGLYWIMFKIKSLFNKSDLNVSALKQSPLPGIGTAYSTDLNGVVTGYFMSLLDIDLLSQEELTKVSISLISCSADNTMIKYTIKDQFFPILNKEQIVSLSKGKNLHIKPDEISGFWYTIKIRYFKTVPLTDKGIPLNPMKHTLYLKCSLNDVQIISNGDIILNKFKIIVLKIRRFFKLIRLKVKKSISRIRRILKICKLYTQSKKIDMSIFYLKNKHKIWIIL